MLLDGAAAWADTYTDDRPGAEAGPEAESGARAQSVDPGSRKCLDAVYRWVHRTASPLEDGADQQQDDDDEGGIVLGSNPGGTQAASAEPHSSSPKSFVLPQVVAYGAGG